MMALKKQKRRVALLLITAGSLFVLSISNVLSENNQLLRALSTENKFSNGNIVNVDSLKVYEYPAPPGMTPEDLFQCFQDQRHLDPTIDNPALKGPPYLPEDMSEWFLHKQIQEYPHKTTNPSEADIFIINAMPILSHVGVKKPCNGMTHYDRQKKWVEILQESAQFQERPEDHVYLCTSWYCAHAISYDMKKMIVPKSMVALTEPVRDWFHGFDNGKRIHSLPDPPAVVIPYLAHSFITPNVDEAELTRVRPHQVTFIGSFDRTSWWRKPLKYEGVQPYLTEHNTGLKNSSPTSVSEFLNGYAETMTNSNFCLVPSGDTQSSRRLFDAMMAGCIPVFPGPEYPLPFEHLIPYNEFSVRIKGRDWIEHAPEEMRKLHEDYDQETIVQMRIEMSKYVKYIDFRHGFDVLEALISSIELQRKSAMKPAPWISEISYMRANRAAIMHQERK